MVGIRTSSLRSVDHTPTLNRQKAWYNWDEMLLLPSEPALILILSQTTYSRKLDKITSLTYDAISEAKPQQLSNLYSIVFGQGIDEGGTKGMSTRKDRGESFSDRWLFLDSKSPRISAFIYLFSDVLDLWSWCIDWEIHLDLKKEW